MDVSRGFSTVYLMQEVGRGRGKFALKHIISHSREDAARANAEIALHGRLARCEHVLALEVPRVPCPP